MATDARQRDLDASEDTVRTSLGVYLRTRYWGRILIHGVSCAIILGLVDAVVPILTWQVALVAASTVFLVASATRRHVQFSCVVLGSATGIHGAMLADRFDPQRCMILVFTVALLGFALHLACSPNVPDRAPENVVLDLADGRQIPMRLLLTGGMQWIALSANGRIYLPDGEHTLTHVGRASITLRVQEDDDGRRYVPDLHSLAGPI